MNARTRNDAGTPGFSQYRQLIGIALAWSELPVVVAASQQVEELLSRVSHSKLFSFERLARRQFAPLTRRGAD
ncbi:MAG: hypothetical protein L0312_03420, partial [Acidobacteria bacterium]|nr:hypothetical protein [Acidobacteriota bacterium]